MSTKRRTALRSTKNGQIFPMNEDMSKSDDTELVYLDEKGKVIEPEEMEPVDAMDLPPLKDGEAGSKLPEGYYKPEDEQKDDDSGEGDSGEGDSGEGDSGEGDSGEGDSGDEDQPENEDTEQTAATDTAQAEKQETPKAAKTSTRTTRRKA